MNDYGSREWINTTLETAEKMLRKNRLVDAESLAQAIVHIDPENSKAFYLLGKIAQTIDMHDVAEELFRESIKHKSDSSSAFFELGRTLMHMGRRDEAVSCFLTAADFSSNTASFQHQLGLEFIAAGDILNAYNCIELAFKKDFLYAGPYHAILSSMKRQTNPENQANEFLEKVAELPLQTRDCFDPWRSLEINTDFSLSPCCIIKFKKKEEILDLRNSRNSKEFKELRLEILSGNLRSTCEQCHIRPLVPVSNFQKKLRSHLGNPSQSPLESIPLRDIRIDITQKCNLRCVYCATNLNGYIAHEMPKTSFPIIIDFLQNQPPGLLVNVNGHGETTHHPDWLDLCNGIIDAGHPPLITTNFAKKFSDDEARCLSKFRFIQISIDTVNAEILKKIRRKVNLKTIIENIEKVRHFSAENEKRQPAFSISCGIYDLSYPNLDDLALFCIENKIQSVTFWKLVKYPDIPNATNVRAVESLENEEVAEAIACVDRAICSLQSARIHVEVAGGFLNEWKKLLTRPQSMPVTAPRQSRGP